MSFTRKQFLSVSGSSILGFSLFNSLSGCGVTPGSSPKKGTGKMNIEVKTKKLELLCRHLLKIYLNNLALYYHKYLLLTNYILSFYLPLIL